MSIDVQIKGSKGIQLIPIETSLLAERKVFIEGEINAKSACEFMKMLMFLNKEDEKLPIDVLINTSGGEINSGMLMYDIIQSSKAPVRTFCMGRAYSMGALLLACGSHGRYILPHGEVMIHEPLLGGSISGTSSSIRSISDSLLETKQKINQLLARHTGKTAGELEEATRYDHFFDPEEAVRFGLCDEIIGFDRVI